ncbi:TetR/AcrR family transcriptional regulator [Paraflavitalea sp. CAU 1676]|uniref:TetR/AcrR family transcriptional regulator n=1 Tax=Paraflavitalea sp. CAU 1676 TaxID=3032598 RepID=UPI0023DADEB5|nr:TetR/AcrR family transcriptional regulator [Paraflavitalea sp. CAU 1676]MDF2186873.1 TetR/AcrR family transcriptional regulator [Paraflavitalea sp. CAU 1676]
MAKIKSNRNSTRKEVIITEAAKLFREKGFSATSMRDLAEHVGVEAASLYNHISSKAEILQEICFKVANLFMTHIEEVDSSPQSAIAKIEAILRFHIRQMIEHYEEVYVSDREWKHLTEPYMQNMQSQRRAYRQRIALVIEEGIRKGEIKAIDAPTAVLIMLHAVSGIESWHRSTKKIEGHVLEDNMVMILVEGLKK